MESSRWARGESRIVSIELGSVFRQNTRTSGDRSIGSVPQAKKAGKNILTAQFVVVHRLALVYRVPLTTTHPPL
jgi:hypothetical protein